MSFFRFLSLVSLPFLFFGNVVAECIDLSGTYLCAKTMPVTISKDSAGKGLSAFNMTVEENGFKVTRPLLEIDGITDLTTECVGNSIKAEANVREGLIIVETKLLNDGEVLTVSMEMRGANDVLVRRDEMSCDRQ